MRIMILGAGQIGERLARSLVSDKNDIVLVDHNADVLDTIRAHIDIQTITGHAASPTILLEAGIEQTDLVIAVTSSDETNMLACLIATKLFSTPKTVARVRFHDYHLYPELFKKNILAIQTIIYPTQAIIQHIIRMIHYPDFTQILNFYQDSICLVSFDVQINDWVHGKTIGELNKQIENLNTNVVALFHKRLPIPLEKNYQLTNKDKIIFITQEKKLSELLAQLKRQPKPHSRIMIAGGGRIGSELAKQLESNHQVKLLEISPEKIEKSASELNKTLLIVGDISDRELLLNENIEDFDVFCAVTNHDETNIMASLQAKYLGAKYAMALVNHENYIDLIDDSVIDAALSPQSISLGHILSKVRHGNMIKIHHIHEETEAIEIIVEGTEQTSSVIGRPIAEIEFPPDCIIAGIMRGKKLYFADSDVVLAAGDHIILILLKQKYIHQLEALFAINLTFMS